MAKRTIRQFLASGAVTASTMAIAGVGTTGMAAAAPSISLTGPDSVNIIRTSSSFGNDGRNDFQHRNFDNDFGNFGGFGAVTRHIFTNNVRTDIRNTNDIDISNNVRQTAETGDVTVSRNTVVGDVSSGDASNFSSASIDVSVENN